MKNYGGHFDVASKIEEVAKLEKEIGNPTFWEDKKHSEQVISQLSELKKWTTTFINVKNRLSSDEEFISILTEEDEETKKMIVEDLEALSSTLENISYLTYFNGPYDHNNCILEVHSGQAEPKLVTGR